MIRRGTTHAFQSLCGVMLGAALVFFAFIGFDANFTHSEEAIKPQRDVPIGILASLAICTLLYLGVSAVITGMVPYSGYGSRMRQWRRRSPIRRKNRIAGF